MKRSTFIATLSAFASTLFLVGSSSAIAQVETDAVTPAATSYSFTEVNYSGDTFTQLLGINYKNVIAGYHGSGLDPANPNKGFYLTLPSTYVAQNYPGSLQTQAIGINRNENTAGFYVDTKQVTHGYFQVGGTFKTIDFPGTTFNQILSLNDNGQAAGYWQDSAGNFHPYTWQNSGAIFSELFIPGAVSAQATGINNEGQICGFYIDAHQNNYGFLITPTLYTKLVYPGATFTQALGLNNKDQVVGTYVDTSNNMHGFVYNTSTKTYQSVDDPNGIGTTIVNGINDSGALVGFWGNTAAGISHGFVALP